MIIKIPNENKQIKQTNKSDVLGNIWASFNLDLTENYGRIRVSPRGMIVSNETDLANLGTPVAFLMYATSSSDQKIWAIAGTHMFYNSGMPHSPFTEDATAGTIAVGVGSDMELFNSQMYVIGTSEIRKWDGSAWTEIGANIGTSTKVSCCVYGSRLYYSHDSSKISSINVSDANVNPSGTPNAISFTLNLADFGAGSQSSNAITCIRSASNKIWIATKDSTSQNYSAGRGGKIFEWDGASTQATKVYNLESVGAMSMIIKDDIPYVVDADGKLLKFTGNSFQEVARLPIPTNKYLKNPLNSVADVFIHPRGMAIRNGKIVMLINGLVDDSTDSSLSNLPAGIWEYDENIGLYHKQSISLWQNAVTTTRTDYAQFRVAEVGALFNAKSTNDSASLNGDLMFGVKYNPTPTTELAGIFINATLNTKSKIGYLITSKIDSANVQDTWQKIYATHKLLLDSTDRICVKYRTSDVASVEATITYTSTTVFTSTANLSSFAIGDEVEILSGTGGGQIEHITAISEAGGTYTVTVANAITGASGTAKARLQKWISLGEQTSQSIEYKEFSIIQNSAWIQFKVVMYFTGADELNQLQLVSKTHLKAE